ncbi:unnamed protein product [Timema podura]|uniref:Uncharacterized protein n=1 Tax=Timema podura TaxID=61482 RepID=A0ABN7PPG9_TIMPD|nr:unnamed protein product [Timema podura]
MFLLTIARLARFTASFDEKGVGGDDDTMDVGGDDDTMDVGGDNHTMDVVGCGQTGDVKGRDQTTVPSPHGVQLPLEEEVGDGPP